MVQCFNTAFTKGELSTSQRQAVITVLDKGKDRSLIENWRPISLLNVDYKIISKTIANSLKVVLPKLIHHNQVGFITGRNVAENLRAISEIFDYTKDFNVAGMLISVDFHKAFDSMEHKFLYAVLEKFTFGPIFYKWVLLFYTIISSCVINNGTTSTYFAVDRGVRQGDPLSPYSFVLAVEILAHMIRVNKNIKRLKIMNQMIKLLQYADDTLGIVQDEISAKHFLQVIIDFGHISGFTLNMTKTEAVWLGVNRNLTDKPLNIRWPALPIKVLGVYFGYDRELCEKRIFGDKIDKAKQIINMWKQRDLSLIGRVQIIKTFITSLFQYSISDVDIPETYIKEVESAIYAFVWKDKKERLKRRVLIKNKEEGGLEVPSFKFIVDSVKLKWFLQIFDSDSEQVWALLARQYFKTNNSDLIN